MTGDEFECRVREVAYRLWEAEGFPEGKAGIHWELAKIAVVRQAAAEAAVIAPNHKADAVSSIGLPDGEGT